MDGIREWAMAVCSVCVLGAAVSLLSPDERCEKLMNMCISVLVLVVAVSPLAKLRSCTAPEIELPNEITAAENELDICIAEQAERYLAITAQELAAARLAEEGIIPKEISVIMDSSDSSSISIGQVTVTLNPEDMESAQAVRQLIAQWLGTENVYVSGG